MNIEELIKRCKASVTVSCNDHRDSYEDVLEYLQGINKSFQEDIDPGVLKKMIELDTIIVLQFYPSTPIGSYTVYHYDVNEAVKIALNILKQEPL